MPEAITTLHPSDSDIETVTPTHQFHPHEQFNALPGKEVPSWRTAFSKTYDLGSGRFQDVATPRTAWPVADGGASTATAARR